MEKMKLSDYAYLWSVWHGVHREYGILPSVREFISLCRAYRDPARRYHALTHIRDCLRFIDLHFGKLDIDGLYYVRMAILYHDIVYDARAKGGANEDASAKQMSDYCWTRFGPHFTTQVTRLIDLTKAHTLDDSAGILDRIMIDADMHIFARSWDAYREYARGVWHEYSFAGKDAYTAGRLAFLGTLDPKTIFHTEAVQQWAWIAERNIKREIKCLRARPREIFQD